MNDSLRSLPEIPASRVSEINALLLLDPDNRAIKAFLEVVERYGMPEEINHRAEEARRPLWRRR